MKKQNMIQRNKFAGIPFVCCSLVVIILCFLVLTPKIASYIFPIKRQMVWNSFIQRVVAEKYINPQGYWQMREFYSPGYFVLSQYYLDPLHKMKISIPKNMPILPNSDTVPFALFSSPHLTSIDSFTPTPILKLYIDTMRLSGYNTLFSSATSGVYKNGKQIVIIFIATEKEMETANGFFDYGEKDKAFVKNKFWLNTTILTLP